MAQEAMAELDMDVFSKHIGPYFSWLESKIETGWQQSDSVPKDVLKEVRSIATTMRARFILGVSRGDFTKEIERAVEVLELACEAFPQESEEIEAKMTQLTGGIAEKLGNDLVPSKYRVQKTAPVEVPKPTSEKPKVVVEKFEKPKTVVEKLDKPKVVVEKFEKPIVKVAAPKPVVMRVQVKANPIKTVVKAPIPKVAKPKAVKVDKKPVAKTKQAKVKAKPKKRSFLSRVFRNFIYGN
ncbi:hypothetical protein J4211_02450 [Candidatus Woesearchaeota archaeon]|nr:hypothetical protein [uncultured archaeon]MBS3125090.1 hypothetical protein [Candidatus Woesearchaeota archaeon]